MPFPGFDTDQIESAAGLDDLSEANLFTSAKPDESIPADVSSHKKAGKLRRRLDHNHAWQKRSAGDVPGDPKLIGPDILEANEFSLIGLGPDDRVEMLHVPALRIGLADPFLIEKDLVQVNAADVVEKWRWHDEVIKNKGGRVRPPMRLLSNLLRYSQS